MHTKALTDRIGPWNESLDLPIPIDVDLLNRAYAAGAKIVSSGELTVFKFNAAQRRNAYQLKSVTEQQAILAKIRSRSDFRLAAMMDLAQSIVSGKFIRVVAPPPGAPGAWYRYNARLKGTLKSTDALQPVTEARRFYLDDQLGGFEWHDPEPGEPWGSTRWSGPSHESTLEFPVICSHGLSITVHVVAHFQENLATGVQILANGRALSLTLETSPAGTALLKPHCPQTKMLTAICA